MRSLPLLRVAWGFQRGGEAVAGDGFGHLLERYNTILVGDEGLAALEAHLGLPYSLEPLQGSLDQRGSAPSGHALNLKVGDG